MNKKPKYVVYLLLGLGQLEASLRKQNIFKAICDCVKIYMIFKINL